VISPKLRLLLQPHFYFAIALLIAVTSFWPSFFSKLSSTDAAHLIHGVSATLWMTMPILQSWLISRKRFKLLILAPVLIVSALHMVQVMVFEYEKMHAIRLLKFAFLDLCALALFVVFLVLAVLRIRRGDSDGHARYMAGTVLFALEPALERGFVFYAGVPNFESALYHSLICMEAILVILLFFEWRTHKVRLPFVMALGFFVAMHVLLTPVANSKAFAEFAQWFARI
jgi:uncharacterized membrane protein YozB (DUF420 family)